MKIYAFDIECYPDFFSLVAINMNCKAKHVQEYIDADIRKDSHGKRAALLKIDHKIFTITKDNNDARPLVTFFKSGIIVVGYNNFGYDDPIVEFVTYYVDTDIVKALTNEVLYSFSQHVIAYKGYNLKRDTPILKGRKKTFISVDIQRLLYLDVQKTSLKQALIATKWYRIQDLPYPFHEPLGEDRFANVLDYNFNDVFGTRHLYWTEHKEVQLRVDVSQIYQVNALSASRSKISDILLQKFYAEYTGLHLWDFIKTRTHRSRIKLSECIFDSIQFTGKVPIRVSKGVLRPGKKTKVYVPQPKITNMVEFLTELKSKVIGTTQDIDYQILMGNSGYTFKSGGLHSIDRPVVERTTDKHIIIDADADSYYPRIVILNGVKPKHLLDAFILVAAMVVKERLEAKSRKDESDTFRVKAEALKIVANAGFFGKFGSDYSFTKDMKALVKVTFNGELGLLMMIETFEAAGIPVISANTDGVVCKVPVDKMEEYNEICMNWQIYTRHTLAYTRYKRYVRQDVNNYITITDKGKIKAKGIFSDKLNVNKGYSMPIISTAIQQFYINDTPIMDTILNHTDIYDFCISQKTGSDFINEYHTIDDTGKNVSNLQKTIRYFVTTTGGGYLYKKYRDRNKRITLLKDKRCVIFNDFYPTESIKDYNVDYNFYRARTMAIINKISGNITIKMRKESGKMFDNI